MWECLASVDPKELGPPPVQEIVVVRDLDDWGSNDLVACTATSGSHVLGVLASMLQLFLSTHSSPRVGASLIHNKIVLASNRGHAITFETKDIRAHTPWYMDEPDAAKWTFVLEGFGMAEEVTAHEVSKNRWELMTPHSTKRLRKREYRKLKHELLAWLAQGGAGTLTIHSVVNEAVPKYAFHMRTLLAPAFWMQADLDNLACMRAQRACSDESECDDGDDAITAEALKKSECVVLPGNKCLNSSTLNSLWTREGSPREYKDPFTRQSLCPSVVINARHADS